MLAAFIVFPTAAGGVRSGDTNGLVASVVPSACRRQAHSGRWPIQFGYEGQVPVGEASCGRVQFSAELVQSITGWNHEHYWKPSAQ